jgi:hypoxanthine-guanine phosphoribosyltransferase
MSDTSSTVSYHGMSLTVLKDSVFFVATLLTKFNVRVDIDSHMENTYITTSFYQDGWLGSLEPRNF